VPGEDRPGTRLRPEPGRAAAAARRRLQWRPQRHFRAGRRDLPAPGLLGATAGGPGRPLAGAPALRLRGAHALPDRGGVGEEGAGDLPAARGGALGAARAERRRGRLTLSAYTALSEPDVRHPPQSAGGP